MKRVLRVAFGVVAPLAVVAILGGCGGDDEQEEGKMASAAGVTEYVGKVSGSQFLIAVAVDKSGKVDAYTCDGGGHSESFSGTTEDDRFALTSADGDATLRATRAASTMSGKVKLEGKSLAFSATEARERGGLYTVQFRSLPDGDARATGESERGNRLVSNATRERLTMTITTADGEPYDAAYERQDGLYGGLRGPTDRQEKLLGFDSYRVIVLDNGQHTGNPTLNSTQLTSQTQLGTQTLKQMTSAFFIPDIWG